MVAHPCFDGVTWVSIATICVRSRPNPILSAIDTLGGAGPEIDYAETGAGWQLHPRGEFRVRRFAERKKAPSLGPPSLARAPGRSKRPERCRLRYAANAMRLVVVLNA